WRSDRSLVDKLAHTLALGDPEAARLLGEAAAAADRPPAGGAPFLKDRSRPPFVRANLALAYAKALAEARVYEEALEAFLAISPEGVADPAAYFFFRAVCEYSLMLQPEAERSLARLLGDVPGAADRYLTVAALMHHEMQTWRDKDLDWVARKMDN